MAHKPGSPAASSSDLALAAGGQPYRLLVCAAREILAGRQTSSDIECGFVEIGCVFGALLHSGEDQRRARLVDKHAVGFVHDRKMQAAQQQRLMAVRQSALEHAHREEPRAGAAGAERKPIAQVVEHELLVGAIGDVTCVGALPLLRELPVLDQPDGETERIVDGRELLGVAAREIVVDGDECTGRPISAAVIAGSSAVKVLPSPVSISASAPPIMAAPPSN